MKECDKPQGYNGGERTWVSLSNYDLDGCVSAIYMNRKYPFMKLFACGYGKLDYNISKTIQYALDHKVTGVVITDWSLTLEQYKRLEDNFEELIFIDHHETSREVSGYIGQSLNTVLCAGVQCAKYIDMKLSKEDKALLGACNAYDNWQTTNKNFQLGKDLTDLFYKINFWQFFQRFIDGFDGLQDHELAFIAKKEAARQKDLAAGIYEEMDEDTLVTILSSGEVVNDVTLYKPDYKKFYIFYPVMGSGHISLSIRLRETDPNFKIGEMLQEQAEKLGEDEVISAGGHDSAGALNFKSSDMNYVLNMMEEFIMGFKG